MVAILNDTNLKCRMNSCIKLQYPDFMTVGFQIFKLGLKELVKVFASDTQFSRPLGIIDHINGSYFE